MTAVSPVPEAYTDIETLIGVRAILVNGKEVLNMEPPKSVTELDNELSNLEVNDWSVTIQDNWAEMKVSGEFPLDNRAEYDEKMKELGWKIEEAWQHGEPYLDVNIVTQMSPEEAIQELR